MSRRWAMALAVLAVWASACTGGSPDRATPRSPIADRRPSPTVLRPLVLTAELSDQPARWHLVTRIPFGRAKATLGMIPRSHRQPGPVFPISFAVAPDGSLWFLDAVKHRVAHFSASGTFLDDVPGVPLDPYHPHPRDVAVAGGVPVLLQTGLDQEGIVRAVASSGTIETVTTHDETGPLYVTSFVQGASRTVGLVEGRLLRTGRFAVRPEGFADLGVARHGSVSFLPGVPLTDGTFLRLLFVHDMRMEARLTRGRTVTELPIRLRLTTNGRALDALASAEFQTALPHGVACLVTIGPSRFADRSYGNSRWFLELSDDDTPLVWQRIPRPSLDDGNVVRHLAAGPDGSVYLMQMTASGVSIYRR